MVLLTTASTGQYNFPPLDRSNLNKIRVIRVIWDNRVVRVIRVIRVITGSSCCSCVSSFRLASAVRNLCRHLAQIRAPLVVHDSSLLPQSG